MRKKRKPVGRRTRRSPYERSLEYATRRLEVALAEQRDYQIRLSKIETEIPYLQSVIRALTPPEQLSEPKYLKESDMRKKAAEAFEITRPALAELVKPNSEAVNQEDFLTNFMPGHELLP